MGAVYWGMSGLVLHGSNDFLKQFEKGRMACARLYGSKQEITDIRSSTVASPVFQLEIACCHAASLKQGVSSNIKVNGPNTSWGSESSARANLEKTMSVVVALT